MNISRWVVRFIMLGVIVLLALLFLITEGKSTKNELNIWDEKLAGYGAYIYQKRIFGRK